MTTQPAVDFKALAMAVRLRMGGMPIPSVAELTGLSKAVLRSRQFRQSCEVQAKQLRDFERQRKRKAGADPRRV